MMSHQLSLLFTNIDWTELYLTAEATDELFQDVRIVTLKSEYVEQIQNMLAEADLFNDLFVVDAINCGKYSIQESVTVNGDRIEVCINADVVNDEVTFRALDMVATALDQLNGENGTIYFGDKMTFTIAELPWLTKH